MRRFTQNTARTIYILMTDSTNPRAGLAGLTLVFTLGKDGANDSTITPTYTSLGDGVYSVELTASHTDTLGDLWLHVTATGANTEDIFGEVRPAEASQSDIAAIKAKTDNLPSDPADASVISGRFDTLDTNLGAVDTVVDAIKAKTDNLPAAPAAVGDVTTVGTAVAAVDTKLGTPAGASVSEDISKTLKTTVFGGAVNP